VTRWVCAKIAQNVARTMFCQEYCKTLTLEKSGPGIWASSVIF
jgi:hypothetical protein